MKKIFTTLMMLAGGMTVLAQSSTTVTVNPAKTYQTMRSWGASDCWTGEYVATYFADAQRRRAAERLFSMDVDANGNPKGIALSQWRVNLGAGSSRQGGASNIEDKTRRVDSYLENDGTTYNWTRCKGQQWFMNAAKEYGVADFLLFSNSPLVQFTKNGLANNKSKASGSNLKSDCYDDFAEYLAECVKHFSDAGYPVSYIDPVNEPAFDWRDGQEGTPWQNIEIAKLIRELNTSLTTRNLKTQILMPEADSYQRLYQTCSDYSGRASNQIEVFWNPSRATYIGDQDHVARIAAGHSYWTFRTNDDLQNVRTQLAEKAAQYGLETAQTEWSMLDAEPTTAAGFPSSYDAASYMDIALYMGKIIYSDIVYGNVSSWSYWTAFGQEKWSQKNRFYLLRLNAQGDNGNESYGDIQNGGTVNDSKNLWVLGNYSRFVRPGYQRIDISGFNAGLNGLMGTGFISPEKDKIVMVFVNMGYARKNVSFNIDGYSVTSMDTYTTDALHNLSHASQPAGQALDFAKGQVTTVVLNVSPTAGISELHADDAHAATYNLKGQKVDAADAHDGIFIVNGKKVMK